LLLVYEVDNIGLATTAAAAATACVYL